MPQAIKPLAKLLPASTPTMESPSSASMKSSAVPKARIKGRAISTAPVKITAPIKPPIMEAMKDADKARAASPRRAMGKPSRIVAWLADDPGMPIRMELNVSAVAATATRPTSMARAET